jgi:hypothetical protein
MKAAGSKFVNQVLLSKRCARHDVKGGSKAKRSKQKVEIHRELKGM